MENMKCDKIKFFQIAASTVSVGENMCSPVLYGLDQFGHVWEGTWLANTVNWRKLSMPEEKL